MSQRPKDFTSLKQSGSLPALRSSPVAERVDVRTLPSLTGALPIATNCSGVAPLSPLLVASSWQSRTRPSHALITARSIPTVIQGPQHRQSIGKHRPNLPTVSGNHNIALKSPLRQKYATCDPDRFVHRSRRRFLKPVPCSSAGPSATAAPDSEHCPEVQSPEANPTLPLDSSVENKSKTKGQVKESRKRKRPAEDHLEAAEKVARVEMLMETPSEMSSSDPSLDGATESVTCGDPFTDDRDNAVSDLREGIATTVPNTVCTNQTDRVTEKATPSRTELGQSNYNVEHSQSERKHLYCAPSVSESTNSSQDDDVEIIGHSCPSGDTTMLSSQLNSSLLQFQVGQDLIRHQLTTALKTSPRLQSLGLLKPKKEPSPQNQSDRDANTKECVQIAGMEPPNVQRQSAVDDYVDDRPSGTIVGSSSLDTLEKNISEDDNPNELLGDTVLPSKAEQVEVEGVKTRSGISSSDYTSMNPLVQVTNIRTGGIIGCLETPAGALLNQVDASSSSTEPSLTPSVADEKYSSQWETAEQRECDMRTLSPEHESYQPVISPVTMNDAADDVTDHADDNMDIGKQPASDWAGNSIELAASDTSSQMAGNDGANSVPSSSPVSPQQLEADCQQASELQQPATPVLDEYSSSASEHFDDNQPSGVVASPGCAEAHSDTTGSVLDNPQASPAPASETSVDHSDPHVDSVDRTCITGSPIADMDEEDSHMDITDPTLCDPGKAESHGVNYSWGDTQIDISEDDSDMDDLPHYEDVLNNGGGAKMQKFLSKVQVAKHDSADGHDGNTAKDSDFDEESNDLDGGWHAMEDHDANPASLDEATADNYLNDSCPPVLSDNENEFDDLPTVDHVLCKRSSSSDIDTGNKEDDLNTSGFGPSVVEPADGDGDFDRLKVMLDRLLSEKRDKAEDNEKLSKDREELDEGIRQGGITKLTLQDHIDEESDLLPEHKKQLEKFQVQSQEISDIAPGEVIFEDSRMRQLFAFPSTLTLEACGFTPGKSALDRTLTTPDPDCLLSLLTSGFIPMCFETISSPEAFLDWLFLLLSEHPDDLVANACLNILLEVLQKESGKGSLWVPSTLTVTRALVNYGADLNVLLPQKGFVDFSQQDLHLNNNKENHSPGHDPVHMREPPAQLLQLDSDFDSVDLNVQCLLQVLTEALVLRPHLYTAEDIQALTVMLLKSSLDQALIDGRLRRDMSMALSALVNSVQTQHWKQFLSKMCTVAPSLATHHHNMLELVGVLPCTERGMSLSRHLSYIYLNILCFGQAPEVTDLKVKQLYPIVQSIQVRGVCDYYRLSSLVFLLDRCVGIQTLPASEKSDLKQLTDMLKSTMGSVREHISDLDRSVVKDTMARLCGKWSIMLDSLGCKQRTIFQYAQQFPPTAQVPIEELTNDQADTVDCDHGDSQSESDSDGDLQHLMQDITV